MNLKPRSKLYRLYHPERRTYLHLSGEGTTGGTDYAWSGTRKQADNVRSGRWTDEAFPLLLVGIEQPEMGESA